MSGPYTTPGLAPPPAISQKTIPMVGLLVDVYGLVELPPSGPVSCLWLLHPRGKDRSRMGDIACRVIGAWNQHNGRSSSGAEKRGLIALCFDQPNHGSRLVSEKANATWLKGNEEHAMDMLGMVKGGVTDMRTLMDLAGGYLGLVERRRQGGGNVVLGVSLGGHGAWQAVMGVDEVDGAVVVVGCPDTMGLMGDRAKRSKLSYDGSFLGSRYFPPDLMESCLKHDPKGVLFGTDALPPLPLSSAEQDRLRPLLDRAVKGKKVLCTFGADDKLVPYRNSKQFLDLMCDATALDGGWYKDGELRLEYKVYEGVGHAFSAEMVEDAVKFLVKVVEEGPRRT